MSAQNCDHLMQAAEALVHALIAKWNASGRPRVATPAVAFYRRGADAGKASRDGRRVWFHRGLMARHWDLYEAEIVAHEVAHCIAFQRYGPHIKPHGPLWRAVGAALGYTLQVSGVMDIQGLKARRTRYVELSTRSGEVVWVSARRYTRACRRGAGLCLRATGEPLSPTGREKLR